MYQPSRLGVSPRGKADKYWLSLRIPPLITERTLVEQSFSYQYSSIWLDHHGPKWNSGEIIVLGWSQRPHSHWELFKNKLGHCPQLHTFLKFLSQKIDFLSSLFTCGKRNWVEVTYYLNYYIPFTSFHNYYSFLYLFWGLLSIFLLYCHYFEKHLFV